MPDMYYRCDDCGCRLQPYTADDGHYVSLREHETRSRLKYGWTLCPECQNKEKYHGSEKGPKAYI